MLLVPPNNITSFINVWKHHIPHQVVQLQSISPRVIEKDVESFFAPPNKVNTQPEHVVPVEVSSTTSVVIPKKYIALTFDDGPYGTSTDKMLSILEKEHVPATFFIIGKNVELHPEQVQREIADGDVIGNHSYSHSKLLPVMSSTTLRLDIAHAQEIISKVSCKVPHLFRPPYSRTSSPMIKEITAEGYVFAGWNVDPRDWDNTNSSSTIIYNVLNYVKTDSIIIFHDGHEEGNDYSRENTIEALPVIIESLKKQGYTFVTMDKIIHTEPYESSEASTICN